MRKQTLRSLSLSYQKKDGRGQARPSFFSFDNYKDLKVCFLVARARQTIILGVYDNKEEGLQHLVSLLTQVEPHSALNEGSTGYSHEIDTFYTGK